MWPKAYKDYPEGAPLTKYQVRTGKGITGCEMHEINGWGEIYHQELPKKKGLIARLLESLFR